MQLMIDYRKVSRDMIILLYFHQPCPTVGNQVNTLKSLYSTKLEDINLILMSKN